VQFKGSLAEYSMNGEFGKPAGIRKLSYAPFGAPVTWNCTSTSNYLELFLGCDLGGLVAAGHIVEAVKALFNESLAPFEAILPTRAVPSADSLESHAPDAERIT